MDDCAIGQEQREWIGNRKFDEAESCRMGNGLNVMERSTCGLLALHNSAQDRLGWDRI
jgi:hypothetical protein